MNNAIYTALYGRLAGGTALTSLLSGTTAIYHDIAPEGATLPYVIFSWAGGGMTPTSNHQDGNGVIFARAYSSASAKSAGAIRDAIYTLLDRVPLTITGWANPWLAAEAPHVELAETDQSGVTVWTSGDDYRLYIDKT